METVIIVIHLMLVVVLIGVVLIQKSEGGGLGIGGGGGGGGFMSSRGTANLLTRTTAIVAGLFFVTSLLLSWLANYERAPTSIINNTSAPLSQPATPVAPSGGGVLDSLKQQEQQAPSVPQPPRSQ
ncbi:MAG: preprotein translocase subunit SecG [Xanthobacteraceae bacterium]|jgi:preprotein translocase subunit SecG|nr:preprotein translocase subunit SecG [Hyphomicrobiales bacterium]MBN8986481.1 preprotein translocase subunit SecG [Hyphomicrobiales bacterium]